MRRYPDQPEQILMPSLGDVEDPPPRRKRRSSRKKTVCADSRLDYAWLRVNPCIAMPDRAKDLPPIQNARMAAAVFHRTVDFAGRGVEYAMVMPVDSKNRPTAVTVSHIGGRAAAIIEPNVILQSPLLTNAIGFILAHNHPSGGLEPSDEDVAMTKRLIEGAKLVGLSMLDSIILSDDPGAYYSMLDAGLMQT